MRLIKYTTELDTNNIPVLVKEKSFNYERQTLGTPSLIAEMFNEVFHLDKQTEEYVYLLCMNSKCKPLGIFEISHGTVNMEILSPREIFNKALLCGAVSIVLVHNHPSGDPTPSEEDMKAYERVKQAGELLNVILVDFLIIGDEDNVLSFYEEKI